MIPQRVDPENRKMDIMNFGTCGQEWAGPPMVKLRYPSDSIMLGDTSTGFAKTGSYNHAAFNMDHRSPQNALTPGYQTSRGGLGTDRHINSANILFFDGHVNSHTAQQLWHSMVAGTATKKMNKYWFGVEEYTGSGKWW